MAKEITVSVSMRCRSGFIDVARDFGATQIDQTGTTGTRVHGPIVQLIGTSYEAVEKGDVGDLGYIALRNLNAAGSAILTVSLDGGTTDHMRLKPGEPCVLRLAPGYDITDLHVKGASGTSRLERTILED